MLVAAWQTQTSANTPLLKTTEILLLLIYTIGIVLSLMGTIIAL